MLDILSAAESFGVRTSKAELVAALVCAFDPTEEGLDVLLKGYRLLRSGEAVIGQGSDAEVIRISRLPPGRPLEG